MAKKPDGLDQGGDTGWALSPLAARQQLDPMPPDESEACDWVLKRLSELDPDADVRELIEDGLDEGWFLVDERGLLRVNPDAPGAMDDEEPSEGFNGEEIQGDPGAGEEHPASQ